jgi:hypothetical protein
VRGLVELSPRGRAHSNEKDLHLRYRGGRKCDVPVATGGWFAVKFTFVQRRAAFLGAGLPFIRAEQEFFARTSAFQRVGPVFREISESRLSEHGASVFFHGPVSEPDLRFEPSKLPRRSHDGIQLATLRPGDGATNLGESHGELAVADV